MFEDERDSEGNDAGCREVLNAENRAKPQAWASDAWLKDISSGKNNSAVERGVLCNYHAFM